MIKKVSLTESTEFAESIDSIDSLLRVLCEKILLLHNSVSLRKYTSPISRYIYESNLINLGGHRNSEE
ncbi:MAG: hypothetical protein IPO06_07525 [Leptospiraceae bacterium]|nr:hypothetical protein [Leptospiraceae bacterium]